MSFRVSVKSFSGKACGAFTAAVESARGGTLRIAFEGVDCPVVRADTARSRRGGHAGLGLALAARVAELHHGRLSIESEEGAGTTVSILFDP